MEWNEMPQPSRERILSDGGNIGTCLERLQYLPQGNYAINLTLTYVKDYQFKCCWDTSTPDWKTVINSGKIINNDLLEMSYEGVYSPTEFVCNARQSTQLFKYTSKSWVDEIKGADKDVPKLYASALAFASSDEGSLRAEAVTSSFARVDVSELEVLASLGEMPETVAWFKDVLRRLIALTAAFKKKQYLEVLRLAKLRLRKPGAIKKSTKKVGTSMEDFWMEWRYAVRPLVFEVQAYLAALDSKVEKAIRKTAVKKSFSVTHQESNLVFQGILPVQVLQESTISRSISAGVLYQLQPDKMGWWTHLGLDAPTSAYWAVWPLSFVYDWFFNIGEWIASWEPRVGLTPLTNWVVETRTVEDNYTFYPGVITSDTWEGFTIIDQSVTKQGGKYCKTQTKTRWANPDRQILPTFRMKELDTAQVLDLTIIGRKLISGLFR